MKEENKYYTPSVEEFHVGFEFEFHSSKSEWKNFIFNLDRADHVLQNVRDNPELFRIKYLDKGGIESLNFKNYSGYKHGIINFTYKSVYDYGGGYLTYNLETKVLKLEIVKDRHDNQGESLAEKLFDGIIKNKSELIKLMKQLQI